MKALFLLLITCLSISSNLFAKTYYVSPSGLSGNTGNSFSSAKDFNSALSMVVAGDSILLEGGTYTIPIATADSINSILFTKSGMAGNPICVVAYKNSQAVFDFSFPSRVWVQDAFGFNVSGSYWYFKGITITRAGYQGAYVKGSHNTFDNCVFYNNRNTGLEINKGGSYTTVINCDSYMNYDPKKGGSMADGFGPKQTQGPGNKFIGCRAWQNSDDGYDCFDSPEVVTFENCWAFRNGVDVWHYGGFTGNGNGLKVGGNFQVANNKLTNCVAFGNPSKGFDQNNNAGGLTLYNCFGYLNGINYGLGGTLNAGQSHELRNNISLGSTVSIANASQSNNSWNSGFAASNTNFQSLDTSLATIARNPDGSLPETLLFRLKLSSTNLVDKGINVGLPYNGAAPDLGPFETGNQAPAVSIASPANNDTFTAIANVTIAAMANDADGSVEKVDFYNGNILIGTDPSSPYSFNFENLSEGTYKITARAIDNQGETGISSIVTILVNHNQPSFIDITSPVNNSAVTVTPVTIQVNASDPDGDITKVEYLDGTTVIGTSTTEPYNYTWSNPSDGNHVITVRVTDSHGGVTTSSSVTVIIGTTTGINVDSYDTFTEAYPNPFCETFTVNSSLAIKKLSVMDMYGVEVINVQDLPAGEQVEIGKNLPQGAYVLFMKYTTERMEVTKLVKIN